MKYVYSGHFTLYYEHQNLFRQLLGLKTKKHIEKNLKFANIQYFHYNIAVGCLILQKKGLENKYFMNIVLTF